MTPEDLQRAARILREGGLVAFPTETVYGLGADASNPQALERLYRVKARPGDHPVIVHLARAEGMRHWARHLPPAAWRLARLFWPGPMTLILQRASHVSDRVTGGQDTVGLRVPGHPLALELLAAFGGGVAAPSANRFGRLSPTRAEHVRADLGEDVDFILDGGPCPVGVESTILDLSQDVPRLLRPGMLSRHRLEEVLGTPLIRGGPGPEDVPRAPGTLSRHYSPLTPVLLVPPDRVEREALQVLDSGAPPAVLALHPPPFALGGDPGWRQVPSDPEGYARELYSALRALDEMDRALIVVEQVPDGPEWDAVRDRLGRAAARAPGSG